MWGVGGLRSKCRETSKGSNNTLASRVGILENVFELFHLPFLSLQMKLLLFTKIQKVLFVTLGYS